MSISQGKLLTKKIQVYEQKKSTKACFQSLPWLVIEICGSKLSFYCNIVGKNVSCDVGLKAGLHIQFPHCIVIFCYLPWLCKTKVSYKKSQSNAVNACGNRVCQLSLNVALLKSCNIIINLSRLSFRNSQYCILQDVNFLHIKLCSLLHSFCCVISCYIFTIQVLLYL